MKTSFGLIPITIVVITASCTPEQAFEPEASRSIHSDAPSATSLVVVDHQRINVSWQDNSSNEIAFEIHRAIGSGAFALRASVPAGATSYSDAGLSEKTQYCYKVRAVNRTGRVLTFSEFSNTACATTSGVPAPPAPAAPSNLSAIPDGRIVRLTWVDNATNDDGWRLEHSLDAGVTWTVIAMGAVPNVTTGVDQTLSPDQQACYRAFAMIGQTLSAPSNVDCTAPPAPPTELTASPIAPAIELTWRDNSSVEDGYEVWRDDGTGAFNMIAQLPASSVSFRDATINLDQRYSYYVRALNDGGASDQSSPVTTVVITVPPAAPIGTSATPLSSTSVSLYWAASSTNEQGFRIERSLNHGSTWDVAGTALESGYAFMEGNRVPELEVCYRVIAFNVRGDSPPSPMGCTVPPRGATNLTVEQTAGGVILHWADNSNVEDGYDVVLWTACTVGDAPDTWIASVGRNITSVFIGDMSPALWCGDYPTAYVVVRKDGGYGDYSNAVYTAP